MFRSSVFAFIKEVSAAFFLFLVIGVLAPMFPSIFQWIDAVVFLFLATLFFFPRSPHVLFLMILVWFWDITNPYNPWIVGVAFLSLWIMTQLFLSSVVNNRTLWALILVMIVGTLWIRGVLTFGIFLFTFLGWESGIPLLSLHWTTTVFMIITHAVLCFLLYGGSMLLSRWWNMSFMRSTS